MSIEKRNTNSIVSFIFGLGVVLLLFAAIAWRFGVSKLLTIATLSVVIALFAEYRYKETMHSVLRTIVKYRWLCAALLFVVCVFFRIHGSSIGMYNIYFPTQTSPHNNILFGNPRAIRSDEWAVQAPTFFSQYYNDYKLYSRQMSVSDMNMVLDYYSPVADIFAIGKPLSWGYLLFGNEIGLSWNWCGLVILIFMSSFEMFYILSKRTTWISILGMLMIGLSPAVQWWVMPHMPIVFAYAMLLFSVGYYFFTSRTIVHKAVFSALAVILIVGYALCIFPSCQIPCGLLMLSLLIAALLRDKNSISFSRIDWLRAAFVAVATVSILVCFVVISKDDILLLMNTAYPGQRISVGGDQSVYSLFTDLYSLFLPYKDSNVSNNCEVSTYIHFAPFFLLLYPRLCRAQDKNDGFGTVIGNVLFIALIIEALFMCIGFPEWLAKLTLFKYINRMKMVYGWTATIFSCWGLYVLSRHHDVLKLWEKIVYPAIYILIYIYIYHTNGIIREYLPPKYFAAELIMFFVLLVFGTFAKRQLLCYMTAAMMLFCGATVNPVSRGIDAITNHPVYSIINDIAEREPEAKWLNLDSSFVVSNYIMACGAKCLDATQFLPDNEKWEVIDPDNRYEFEANRYSNQTACLTDGENSVELTSPDHIIINLNPDTVKCLGVTYIVSTFDYSTLLNSYGIIAEQIFEQDAYMVYHLDY